MTDASRVAQPALDPAILQQAAEWIAQLWSDDVTDQDLSLIHI